MAALALRDVVKVYGRQLAVRGRLVDDVLGYGGVRAAGRGAFALVLFHALEGLGDDLLALEGVHFVEGVHELLEAGGEGGVEVGALLGGGEFVEEVAADALAVELLALVKGEAVDHFFHALDGAGAGVALEGVEVE